MKLTKQKIITLIEEVLTEANFNPGSPDYNAGMKTGLADGRRLAIQYKGVSLRPDNDGNTPLKDTLVAHLEDSIEGQSNDYAAGYKFGFKMYWSAMDPSTVTKGQLPFANTRQRPYPGLFGWKG